jgi:hypothetical protein
MLKLILELPFSLKAEKQGDEAIKSLFFGNKKLSIIRRLETEWLAKIIHQFFLGWLWAAFHKNLS